MDRRTYPIAVSSKDPIRSDPVEARPDHVQTTGRPMVVLNRRESIRSGEWLDYDGLSGVGSSGAVMAGSRSCTRVPPSGESCISAWP